MKCGKSVCRHDQSYPVDLVFCPCFPPCSAKTARTVARLAKLLQTTRRVGEVWKSPLVAPSSEAPPPTTRHARRPVGLQQARALLLGVRSADHGRLRGSQHHVHHARLHTPRCPSGAGARRSNRGIACVRSKQHRYDAERKLACLAARHCCSDRSRWAGSECVSLYLARRPDVCECLGCPCLQCAWATTAGKI